MYPLLASTAVSAAGKIINTIAQNVAKVTSTTAPPAPPAVPFSTLIDQSAAATAAARLSRAQEITTQLGHSPEVAAAANGAGTSGPLSLQIDGQGNAALSLAHGGLQGIQLPEAMRGEVRELYQLQQPGSAGTTKTQPASPITISLG